MSVHDIDGARWLLGAGGATRVFATGTIAIHEGLRACRDVDNAVATIEFEGGQRRNVLRVADDRARPRNDDGDRRHRGRLTVGANPRSNRVEISDAHGVRNECTPTFYERFEEAFLREAHGIRRRRCATDRAPPLTLADATEATRIGIALTESLRSRRPVDL